jgi:hypothetical protein
VLRPCWTCRGSIGGAAGSPLELMEKADPDRLECPGCVQARAAGDLGPLVLPAPTKRELVAALVSSPDDPWWEARVLHAKLYPARDRCDLLALLGVIWLLSPCCLDRLSGRRRLAWLVVAWGCW